MGYIVKISSHKRVFLQPKIITKMKKLVLSTGLAFALFSCSTEVKTETKTNTETSTGKSYTAKEYYKALNEGTYGDDEIITLSNVVYLGDITINKNKAWMFGDSEKDDKIDGVMIVFKEGSQQASTLKKGDKMTIKGKVDSFKGGGMCLVVE